MAEQHATLLKDLQALKSNPPSDPQIRKALLNVLREAEFAVEQPVDTVHRLSWAPIQTSVAKIAVDTKLFDIIARQETHISLEELSKQTGAQPLLLRRLLRFLSLNGMVDEPQPMHYLPNDRTRTMADPGIQAGLSHNFAIQGPAYHKLVDFLRANNYRDVTDAAKTPFQLAHNTDHPAMVWAMTKPDVIQEFSVWMAALRNISPSWLDTFPMELLLEDTSSQTPVFIDIGGSLGHQCEELVHRVPQITSRAVVLQDQAPVIQIALQTSGVENQVYDFFTPQPLKGASFYYMKSVLHDWPDAKVLEILKNQVSAMMEGPTRSSSSSSRILLDEVVLPESGGHWRAAEMDIALMACAGSFERTEEQWKTLFERAGLKKVAQYYYDDQMLYAVQILEKA